MKKIAIFASGSGSNAKNLLQHAPRFKNLTIEFILTDNENAGVVNYAKELNCPVIIVSKKNLSKKEHEQEILKYLQEHKIEWILLAGYMRILSPEFLEHFYNHKTKLNQVINIHPSLLPEYKGLNAFERAYKDQRDKSGISIHYVSAGVDDGPLIYQEVFKREQNDSLESFIKKGQALEHKLYPQILESLNQSSHPKPMEQA